MRIVRIITSVVFVLIALSTFWFNRTIDKANAMKDEANAALNAANDLTVTAGQKIGAIEEKSFATDRAAIEPLAKEAADMLTKSAAKYREAAEKMHGASEAVADDAAKEYFQLEADHLKKLAEVKDLFAERTKSYFDEAVKTEEELVAKLNAADALLTPAMEAENALEKKADEFSETHKDKIKK